MAIKNISDNGIIRKYPKQPTILVIKRGGYKKGKNLCEIYASRGTGINAEVIIENAFT